jgi:copper oxidase (laccase) domain-containing protein
VGAAHQRAEVADAGDGELRGDAVLAWPGTTRPHLDLARAVATQLTVAGVGDLRPLVSCTHCDRERLWSYRRDGSAAGRNLALIWKTT